MPGASYPNRRRVVRAPLAGKGCMTSARSRPERDRPNMNPSSLSIDSTKKPRRRVVCAIPQPLSRTLSNRIPRPRDRSPIQQVPVRSRGPLDEVRDKVRDKGADGGAPAHPQWRRRRVFQPNLSIILSTGLLVGGAGCAWRQPTSARTPNTDSHRSAFVINLHCEPEEEFADWEEQQIAEVERERLFGDAAAASLLSDDPAEEDCGLLIEAIQEGSDALLSEARYDRVRNRQ